MKEQIAALKKTLEDAKAIIDEKLTGSAETVQNAIDSHRSVLDKKTLIDSCNDWLAIVKDDTFEKGRKSGYAEACDHLLPLLKQSKSLIDQFDEISKKSIGSLENLVTVLNDKLADAGKTLTDRGKEIAQLKGQLTALEANNTSLKKKTESLQKNIDKINAAQEPKPKKGRPKKKKDNDPLA